MTIKINPDLYLAPVKILDAKTVFELIEQDRSFMHLWLPWVSETKSVNDVKTYFKHAISQNLAGEGLQLTINYQNAIAGLIGLHYIDKHNNSTSIGYWLGVDYRGKGIMTLATKYLCGYCFNRLHLNRIEISCAVGNTKSMAIPKKLNFVLEGTQREKQFLNGQYHDHHLFALLKSEFKDNLIL